jgi:hypothetical protein
MDASGVLRGNDCHYMVVGQAALSRPLPAKTDRIVCGHRISLVCIGLFHKNGKYRIESFEKHNTFCHICTLYEQERKPVETNT